MSLLLLQGHGLDLIVLWIRFSRCLKSIIYQCVIKKGGYATVKALQWVLPKISTPRMLTPRISTLKMSTSAKLEHSKQTL